MKQIFALSGFLALAAFAMMSKASIGTAQTTAFVPGIELTPETIELPPSPTTRIPETAIYGQAPKAHVAKTARAQICEIQPLLTGGVVRYCH